MTISNKAALLFAVIWLGGCQDSYQKALTQLDELARFCALPKGCVIFNEPGIPDVIMIHDACDSDTAKAMDAKHCVEKWAIGHGFHYVDPGPSDDG